MGFKKLLKRNKLIISLAVLFAMLIILLILMVFLFNFSYENIPKPLTGSNNRFYLASSFHWSHMPLVFIIEDECSDYVKRRVRGAFNEISNATENAVSFFELKYYPERIESADILIKCNSSFPRSTMNDKVFYTQAEAQITEISGTLIESANITFYNVGQNKYYGACMNYPDVEIHEILHVLGFSHVNQKASLLSPVSFGCRHDIDKGVIKLIKATYGYEN